jgi:hypothetical protein
MNNPWFEKSDDGTSWVFTVSGKDDDPNNFHAEELDMLFKFGPKYFRENITKIVLEYDGECEFHFKDDTPSVSTAFRGKSYIFLEAVGLMCLGMVIRFSEAQNNHPPEVVKWFNKFLDYRK